MRVILAGYSKTGTKTMCEAFRILGYNTYDEIESGYYLHNEWAKMITVGGTAEDFRRMYEGVDAVTDLPCYIFWEQLHEAFPDAKIILILRDEDQWYRSFVKQIDELNGSLLVWLMNMFSPLEWRMQSFHYHILKMSCDVQQFPTFRKRIFGETLMKKLYREHNYYVQQKAPKDKLLVYKVSEGWEPLCKFLGEKIPNKLFPHKNKGASITAEMWRENKIARKILFQGCVTLGVLTTLGVAVGYKLYQGGHFEKVWNLVPSHVTMVRSYYLPA